MTIVQDRDRAVAVAVERIRAIEETDGVNPGALAKIKDVLLGLAGQRSLFPIGDFPIDTATDGNSVIYRLSEDADHRFALYASAALPDKGVPPHNHTTWAVIVGVHGDEHNIFYERTDDGSVDGEGTVGVVSEETVTVGNGVTLMPDDIHSIHVTGEAQTVHLHMYGLALEQLHERVMYNRELGTYTVFPATQNIKAMSA